MKRLKRNHRVLCTTRKYAEVTNLAKIRKIKLISIGKHGGSEKSSKLVSSLSRMSSLSLLITKFSPDITVSFCSPEAARISYGLGIYHIAFSDSPHAKAVMKLSIPFVQKLLTPWIIPKREFTQFGINSNDIIQYKAIDAASIINRKTAKIKLPFNVKRKTILVRVEEEQAAYLSRNSKVSQIIQEITKKFEDLNIVVLARYPSQINRLRKTFGTKIKILKMSIDGKTLLNNTDVFVGSGGTMTAESALLGVPTISYNAVPNYIENFLVQKNIVKRVTSPKKITGMITQMLTKSNDGRKKRVKKLLAEMEDPYMKLIKVLKTV